MNDGNDPEDKPTFRQHQDADCAVAVEGSGAHNTCTESYSSPVSNYDPFDQASQESKRKQRELKEQLASKSEQDDVAWLMSSKRGRRILWRFLDRAGVYRTSFNQNSMTMAFNEGVRNEGLRLVATIHTCAPEQYPVMLKEANDN